MKKLLPSTQRGQALILITLAAIGLFAIAGLAIDGSIKYSDRRHAQNAADTAALAGALELARDEKPNLSKTWDVVARDVAKKNGYTGDLLHSQIWVHYCDAISAKSPADCGPYNGYHNYIQVIIVSYVDTYFARVIGITRTTNSVQAVTHWTPDGPTYGPEILKSYNPNPCTGDNGNIVFGGNGNVTLDGGGAYINSGGDGSCGIELTGCGDLSIIDGDLSSVGDGNINLETSSGHCAETLNVPGEDQYKYNADPTPFEPEMPPVPDECNPTEENWGHWDNAGGVSYLYPGWYVEFPPKKTALQDVEDDIFMYPGTYCVKDVVKLIDQHLTLTGHDVTIYVRGSGGQFDVQGGHIELDAPDSGPYAGYLIILDTDFTGTPPNCTIDGNSSNIYVGTIFAPYCDFIFNGTNETGDPDLHYGTQVIAYTITLNGNSNIYFYYDPQDVANSDPKVGMMQ